LPLSIVSVFYKPHRPRSLRPRPFFRRRAAASRMESHINPVRLLAPCSKHGIRARQMPCL